MEFYKKAKAYLNSGMSYILLICCLGCISPNDRTKSEGEFIDSLFMAKSPELLQFVGYSVSEDTTLVPPIVEQIGVYDMYIRSKWEAYLFSYDKRYSNKGGDIDSVLVKARMATSIGYHDDTISFGFAFIDAVSGGLIHKTEMPSFFSCRFQHSSRKFLGYNFGMNKNLVPALYVSIEGYKERTERFVAYLEGCGFFPEKNQLLQFYERNRPILPLDSHL